MILKKETAQAINQLARFCGKRELPAIKQQLSTDKIDIAVLFGGSILQGGDVFAQIIKEKVAAKTIIVGGFGHTTRLLFKQAEKEIPGISTNVTTEAQLFANYLKIKYDLTADYLETKSTNCGNNITYLLDLIQKKQLKMNSILMIQDASMQLRMEACLRKYLSKEVKIINYAAYQTSVIVENNQLIYDRPIHGMWEIDHYLSLLMGEIPRLYDNENGYGPNGKQFIAHVDIPQEVLAAYCFLQKKFPDATRSANDDYASK